jgi:hypothetical protein
MICYQCRKAGEFNQSANANPKSFSSGALTALAENAHRACDNKCDCQHVVGQAIVTAKVRPGVS